MNRQVKFRAYLWSDRHTNDQWLDWEDGIINFWSAYLHWQGEKSLMQFTGLLDQNSVEIYEGDLVKFLYSRKEYTLPVVWGTGGWWVQGNGWFKELYWVKDRCDVIGNIHEDALRDAITNVETTGTPDVGES